MSYLILLTNDDGFFSAGLEALSACLQATAEIYVVAPDREKSATSLSLTLHRPLRVQQVKPKVYAVDGTPADCVYLAVQKILPSPPHLVISGINRGPNLGRQDVAYSGTVAAALQAAFLGLRSLAISLLPSPQGDFFFPEAAALICPVIKYFIENPFPQGLALNINIPSPPVKGVRITSLGEKHYRPPIVENIDPRGKAYYWIGSGNPRETAGKDTDIEAIKEGYLSMTPLRVDFTATEYLSSSFWQGIINLF